MEIQNSFVEKQEAFPIVEELKVENENSNSASQPTEQYKNLKMKYYRSLGVNGVVIPNSLPNSSGIATSNQTLSERTRTKTMDPSLAVSRKLPNRDSTISPRKKRSTSTPIPITMPQAIPGIPRANQFSDSEDEDIEDEELYPDEIDSSFIPPHQMLERQHDHSNFAVGTAHSVAVWEQKRRNLMNV
jgi:hypothetical protein